MTITDVCEIQHHRYFKDITDSTPMICRWWLAGALLITMQKKSDWFEQQFGFSMLEINRDENTA